MFTERITKTLFSFFHVKLDSCAYIYWLIIHCLHVHKVFLPYKIQSEKHYHQVMIPNCSTNKGKNIPTHESRDFICKCVQNSHYLQNIKNFPCQIIFSECITNTKHYYASYLRSTNKAQCLHLWSLPLK